MMPWYPRDFLASTRGWPLISRAIYRELLDSQWEQGGLPRDAADLRALVGATAAEWRVGWAKVAPKFPVDTDSLRRNRKLEEHRQKAMDIAHKRTHIGKLGGMASAAKRQAIAQPTVNRRSTIKTIQDSRKLTTGERYLRSEDPEAESSLP